MEKNEAKALQFEAVFLLSAARRGQLEKVQEMIEIAGYPVNIDGDEGYTALHLAVLKGHVQMASYLIEKGANALSKNAHEETPWQTAVKLGDKEMKDALMGKQLVSGECPVCLEEGRPLYAWPCGHQLCLTCAQGWLLAKLKENEPFCCSAPKCSESEPTWRDAAMLLKREHQRQHDQQSLERHLRTRKDFHSCVACNSGGWLDKDKETDDCTVVSCSNCLESWCRLCRLPPHTTMSCSEWRKVYDATEAASFKWKQDNCRSCPQCRSPIVRDGGCSHMVCRKCQFQFCWICLGKYQSGRYTTENNGSCPCVRQ